MRYIICYKAHKEGDNDDRFTIDLNFYDECFSTNIYIKHKFIYGHLIDGVKDMSGLPCNGVLVDQRAIDSLKATYGEDFKGFSVYKVTLEELH